MVNTGKPSTGCYHCRRSRVKCDEARPSCARCLRIGVTCEGYRHTNDVLFRDETRKTIQKVTKTLPNIPGPDARITVPPLEQSLCLFFADHTAIRMEEGDPGYLDYLPSMYREAKPGSALVQTVRAIALTHLYNSGNFPEVKSSARKYYGEALATINKALHDPVERLEDDIMLSIWLMQLYEAREVRSAVLTGESARVVEQSTAWISHMQGLVMLLRLRGTHQLSTLRGRNVCAQMKSLPMPSPCMSAVERTRVYQEALRLKEIAMHLQRSSLDWPGCRDGKWKPRFVSLPIMLPGATQLCSREAEYFQDSHAFRLWSVFRGTMIVLHETLLKFGKDYAAASIDSQHLASGEDVILWDFERSYCVQAISSTADEILNTLPFVFGEITNVGQVRAGSDAGWGDRSKQSHLGVPAIWFLRMIKSSMYTSSTQKALATEGLYKIGRRMGIRQALTVAGA
ncbi:hypothetical protein LTR97_007039 [Elasticomyces elasticus]|uniref:Zn(2)-C6 fungal-type domain-containing protein n=1 Tax=Elasticomyces elasticus TaxID=574655 RepID=A0AAN7VRH9_9PEZI|nr:hypothetical protein LTR97_007039 [Elasticomyces elasticus]